MLSCLSLRMAISGLAALTSFPAFSPGACVVPTQFISEVVYVINGTNILEFDTSGNFILQFGGTGSGPGQFQLPSGITVDGNGRVWVTDALLNRVQEFDSCGVLLRGFGFTGSAPGFLYQPYGIAAFGNGVGATGPIFISGYRQQPYPKSNIRWCQ